MAKLLGFGQSHHNYPDPQQPRLAAINRITTPVKKQKRFRLVSYNIKHSKNVVKAIALFRSNPRLAKADVICLQEMDPFGVQLMAHELNYNYVYYPAIKHPRLGKDFGNAILSKYRILKHWKVMLPIMSPGKLQRIAVNALVKIHKTKVMISSVHMKVYIRKKHRKYPVDLLTSSLPKSVAHGIVAGDFNTITKQNAATFASHFVDAGFHLATRNVNWSYQYWYLLNKKSLLDHIFVKNMKVMDTGTVIDHGPSDHIPIWADLKYPRV